eukprot:TRINITY_DN3610_c0_g2_i2.p2 TRINITY_DN3610_c0_g2~~TRINITY_DN3610_c0_g2_i2.p2  ORF type:complete len:267 (+),score=73.20 TRINITY_DN3610_c0_g2_i2:1171-1971(+)
MAIENPLEPENDLGKAVFASHMLKAAFSAAHKALTAPDTPTDTPTTRLMRILKLDKEFEDKRRHVQEMYQRAPRAVRDTSSPAVRHSASYIPSPATNRVVPVSHLPSVPLSIQRKVASDSSSSETDVPRRKKPKSRRKRSQNPTTPTRTNTGRTTLESSLDSSPGSGGDAPSTRHKAPARRRSPLAAEVPLATPPPPPSAPAAPPSVRSSTPPSPRTPHHPVVAAPPAPLSTSQVRPPLPPRLPLFNHKCGSPAIENLYRAGPLCE